MFSGSIVWRGIIYTLLMAIGKLACGLWLVRFSFNPSLPSLFTPGNTSNLRKLGSCGQSKSPKETKVATELSGTENAVPQQNTPESSTQPQAQAQPEPDRTDSKLQSPRPRKPVSLYPAGILGSAMVARGEIGFLISSIAETQGIFTSESNGAENDDLYLVVTWAIMLCTIFGPLSVGLLVKHVKKLQGGVGGGRRDALGVWGVE
jgi:hypothetical protein